jgi:hypothetical protein
MQSMPASAPDVVPEPEVMPEPEFMLDPEFMPDPEVPPELMSEPEFMLEPLADEVPLADPPLVYCTRRPRCYWSCRRPLNRSAPSRRSRRAPLRRRHQLMLERVLQGTPAILLCAEIEHGRGNAFA